MENPKSNETRMVAEFLKMKAVLDKKEDECESVLFNSLSKLQYMVVSLKILEETGIGKSVSVLQNHTSRDIRQIARKIIKVWRSVVDEWKNDMFVVQQEEEIKEKEIGESKKDSVPMSKQQRPLTIRIKIKKFEINSGKESVVKGGAVTPEQKVESSNEVDEVFRIKDILEKSQQEIQPDSVVCDLLNKLQDMGLCVKTLEETLIGKTVSVLQKHKSKDVCMIATKLVKGWKAMVKEWIKKEESGAVKQTSEQVTKPMRIKKDDSRVVKPTSERVIKPMQIKKDESSVVKPISEQVIKPMSLNIGRNIQVIPENGKNTSYSEERLVAAKRRLCHNAMEAAKLKKKRCVQVMEVHELAKQGLSYPRKVERIKNDESISVVKPISKQVKKPLMHLNIERKIQVVPENGKNTSDMEESIEAAKRKVYQDYKEAEDMRKKRRSQMMWGLHQLSKEGLLPNKSGANFTRKYCV